MAVDGVGQQASPTNGGLAQAGRGSIGFLSSTQFTTYEYAYGCRTLLRRRHMYIRAPLFQCQASNTDTRPAALLKFRAHALLQSLKFQSLCWLQFSDGMQKLASPRQ